MISQAQLEQIDAYIIAQPMLSEDTVSQLRQHFPDIHFTYCMDDDIAVNAKPVTQHARFNLYLIDSRQHCLSLTNDADIATGVVVAEVEEE